MRRQIRQFDAPVIVFDQLRQKALQSAFRRARVRQPVEFFEILGESIEFGMLAL